MFVPITWRAALSKLQEQVLTKTQSLAIIATLVFLGTNLLAQGNAPTAYLYVYPSDPSAYPGQSNQVLQDLFNAYQVVGYFKSFPGAENPSLQNAYEVHCQGDVEELKLKLEDTGLFQELELQGYMKTVNIKMLDCPDQCSSPMSVNDPNSGYELDLPGYPCAWNITQGDPSVVVAVVDTDFDLNHPDLQGQIISKEGTAGSPECVYHGTIVAGTIVAKANNGIDVAGVAPGVRVAGYVVRSIGNCVGGDISCTGDPWPQVWKAYKDGHRIINVSWGSLNGSSAVTPTLLNSITEMTQNGTMVVLAAGNGGPGEIGHPTYSNIPGVLNVSSISSDGTLHEWVHYNEYVDLCAPGDGVGVVTYDLCGTNRTIVYGTSLSAPNAAGAAALVMSVNPCLPPAEIENILKTTTCPIVDNPYPNWTGTGYLNAYAAVEKAKGYTGTVNSNSTWNGENYVSSDITVPSGITLTIYGVAKFSEGTGLIIKPGGRVNLYGRLTNGCMGPWKGVVVEGMANESQYTPGKHGRLYAYDGAVIENAMRGVELVNGGILYGASTTFKNNGTGVSYSPYSNYWPNSSPQQPRNYLGSMNNCTFLFNNDFGKAAPIGAGIEMRDVNGIIIQGCSFINGRSIKNPISLADYGYGIKATDARFNVVSLGIGNTYPPTSYDHTVFKGLGYGVYIGTAQPGTNATFNTSDDFVNVPYLVQQATFEGCIYGIHNRFVSQGTIVGNNFKMGTLPPIGSIGNSPFTNLQIGVFIENGANGFVLQQNHFSKIEDNVPFAYGSYCQNLGWFNNVVRKNTYSNVEVGNMAEQNNATTGPVRGLYYLCNGNTTQNHDFYVPNGDIRWIQGEEIPLSDPPAFKSAGNTFTKTNPPHGDFRNNGAQVRYIYFGNVEKPLYHTGLSLSSTNNQNACDVSYCLPPCSWDGPQDDYAATYAQYLNAINDGQTALSTGDTVLAEQKLGEGSAYRLRLDQMANTLSLQKTFDTLAYHIDSVRVWWQRMESPVSDMVLARDYLSKGQNAAALATLASISGHYDLSGDELVELADYREVMLLMQGETVDALSPNKIEQLLDYAQQGEGIGAAWAKNILTLRGYHFPPQPILLQEEGQERSTQMLEQPAPKPFVVSPNPAKDRVFFKQVPNTSWRIESVTVTDATGRDVWHTNDSSPSILWHTGDVEAGVYFYVIQGSNGAVQSGRIAIVK